MSYIKTTKTAVSARKITNFVELPLGSIVNNVQVQDLSGAFFGKLVQGFFVSAQ